MGLVGKDVAVSKVYDLCVIGAGFAGLALALGCRERGLSVLLVEASGHEPETPDGGEDVGSVAPGSPHAPTPAVCRRAPGGAGRWWGGRCSPLDPFDFDAGDGGPSDWPIDFAALDAWTSEAARFLGCGDAFRVAPPEGWTRDGAIRAEKQERWARPLDAFKRHAPRLMAPEGPDILFSTVATSLDYAYGASGAVVTAVRARIGGRGAPVRLPARAVALCCGGLRTTRLLLAERRRREDVFGPETGPLGARYSGHITGTAALIRLADPADARHFSLRLDASGARARRFLSLPAETLRAQCLGNIVFWLENPPCNDPRHGSAYLSTKALIRAVGEPARGAGQSGTPLALAAHFGNILRDFAPGAVDLSRAAARALGGTAPAGLAGARGLYALHYHAELRATEDSRVILDEACDSFGTPRLRIEFTTPEADIDAVRRAHVALDAALRREGKGALLIEGGERTLRDRIGAQALDGYHQLGTTRMAAAPGDGVVDADCRVHGVSNLYIAATSVFPRAGSANPTLPLVALARRLAGHIAEVRREAPVELAEMRTA